MENRMVCISLLTALLAVSSLVQGQEIWNGNFIEFTKDSLADWTLEENQDRITDNVWITRKNTQGIFNIRQEDGFSHLNGSPVDTEWSYGTTEEIDQLIFEPWASAIDSMVPQMLGQDMVVHLITDDIYIDIEFLEWGITHAGFGYFKYRRATENVPLSTKDLDAQDLTLFPNPVTEYLAIEGLETPVSYRIIDVSGALVFNGIYDPDVRIDMAQLNGGMYYIVLDEKQLLKFIKK